MSTAPPDDRAPPSPLLWLLVFALAAFNLRAPIVVVGPVLEPIMQTLSLGASTASLLTTGMIICFGLLSPLAPSFAGRVGLDRAIATALSAVAAGALLRSIDSLPVMLAGTLLAGAGIAFGNVFMPSLVKRDRPERLGQTMGLYTVIMGIGATLSAATAVPLMQLGGSWRVPLGLWAGMAGVAALGWWWFTRHAPKHPGTGASLDLRAIIRSTTAWTLTVFMGLQSLGFYTIQTWLAAVATSAGVGGATAGTMLSLLNLTSIPSSYLVARAATRMRRPAWLVLGLCTLIATGLLGLLLAPERAPLLWAVALGAGQGGSFSFALTMIVLRTRKADHAAMLSGMSQSIGYLLAAGGPLVFGALHALLGHWQGSLWLLLALLGVQAVAGVLIARPRMVTLRDRAGAGRT